MFWALLILPFVLLGLAALIARKGVVFRSALALAAIFAVIDGLYFGSYSQSRNRPRAL